MIEVAQDGTRRLLFAGLGRLQGIRHGVFERRPGASPPPWDALNVSFAVGDEPERVLRNRRAVAAGLGARRLLFARQVHGEDVALVDRTTDLEAWETEGGPPTADALVTDRPGVFLAVAVADCQPILMADPVRRVVAAVHAGWRGTALDLPGKTVHTMILRFGCDPRDLRVGIGPSLGPCCGELRSFRRDLPPALWKYRREGTACFDFWAATRDQLIARGVPPEQIEVGGLCTRCHPERFFSYRAEKTTGRFPAAIGVAP